MPVFSNPFTQAPRGPTAPTNPFKAPQPIGSDPSQNPAGGQPAGTYETPSYPFQVQGPQATDLGMGPNVNGSGSSSFTPQVAGASGKAAVAIKFAMSQLGKPYKWGGNGPSSWDCSSLVQAAYKAAGLPIPRTTWDQMKGGAAVASLAGAQPGDLLFFGGGSHVAIYLGNGQMIEAPRTGLNVRQTTARTPTSIRRFF